MFNPRMKSKTAAQFCRRFGTGIQSGADLLVLLRSEAKYGTAAHKAAIQALHDGAKNGEALYKLMEANQPYFPKLMVAMVRTGELTGRLERTLFALADHYDQQVDLQRMFVKAVTLPLLQLFAGIGVVSLLIYLMGVLSAPGGGPMTDLLGFGLRGGEGVLKFWGFLALFFGMIGGVVWAFWRNVLGLQNLIPLLYMIPMIGNALQTITLAKYSWTLSLALDAGLDPISSISMALDSTASEYYISAKQTAEDAIRGGASLAGAMKATELFPEEFLAQVEMAELSGTDAESIGGLARDYDTRARTALRTITMLFSGAIWLFMICFMLFMIIRILMVVVGGYAEAFEPI